MAYRGTSLIRKRPPPEDHHMTLGIVLMSEVPLYSSGFSRKPQYFRYRHRAVVRALGYPLSDEFGTHKPAKTRFWPWFEPFSVLSCSILARKRKPKALI